MKAEGFEALKNKIHHYLANDRLKEAITTLFQMLAEHPQNGLEKRTIITAAALKRLENAWRNQIVDWNTYAGGKNALIAEVYEIMAGVEQLIALPAGDSSYENKHREVYEKVKRLLRKLGETPQTPVALLLLALGLASSERTTSSFTDPRDGQVYRTVQLIGKTWLAENLNYDVGEGCWFYDDDPGNGKKYGRLYTWEAAKRACPPGWRLPEKEETEELIGYFGEATSAYKALIEGGSSGFNALLGGSNSGNEYLGRLGFYWSATERGADDAWYYYFSSDDRRVNLYGYFSLSVGFSCRCLRA